MIVADACYSFVFLLHLIQHGRKLRNGDEGTANMMPLVRRAALPLQLFGVDIMKNKKQAVGSLFLLLFSLSPDNASATCTWITVYIILTCLLCSAI